LGFAAARGEAEDGGDEGSRGEGGRLHERRIARQLIASSEGYYAVHALWTEPQSDARADMWIGMFFERSDTTLEGDGWPFLA
jgi:hypothetical protein